MVGVKCTCVIFIMSDEYLHVWYGITQRGVCVRGWGEQSRGVGSESPSLAHTDRMVAGLSSSSGYQSAHSRLGVWTGTLSAWNVPGHSYEVLGLSLLPADSTWLSSMASLNMRGDTMATVCFCLAGHWALQLLQLHRKQDGPERPSGELLAALANRPAVVDSGPVNPWSRGSVLCFSIPVEPELKGPSVVSQEIKVTLDQFLSFEC